MRCTRTLVDEEEGEVMDRGTVVPCSLTVAVTLSGKGIVSVPSGGTSMVLASCTGTFITSFSSSGESITPEVVMCGVRRCGVGDEAKECMEGMGNYDATKGEFERTCDWYSLLGEDEGGDSGGDEGGGEGMAEGGGNGDAANDDIARDDDDDLDDCVSTASTTNLDVLNYDKLNTTLTSLHSQLAEERVERRRVAQEVSRLQECLDSERGEGRKSREIVAEMGNKLMALKVSTAITAKKRGELEEELEGAGEERRKLERERVEFESRLVEAGESLDRSRKSEEVANHFKGHIASRQMRILKELNDRNKVDQSFEEEAKAHGWGGEEEVVEGKGVEGKGVAVARLRAKNKTLKEIIIKVGGEKRELEERLGGERGRIRELEETVKELEGLVEGKGREMTDKVEKLEGEMGRKVAGLEEELKGEREGRKEEVEGLRGVVMTMEEEYEGLRGDIRDMEEGWGKEREGWAREREELEQELIKVKTENANYCMEIDVLGQRCRVMERERGGVN
ncbi:hypothetical protein TrRE_jg5161 [Triparma retinervis]|uniref:Uncharacterized protein n=1 Tax=Triparma retinervis TaxID=2557542 RepID=A0A9W7E039_9STRA|nr:hypothetical protein TrRE_jg5161 [Triparma retinervis]